MIVWKCLCFSYQLPLVCRLSFEEWVFSNHKRTVNKVCFHPNESHLLLTGSQDGNMILFDLRRHEAVHTFYSSSESVRDVQFCTAPNQLFQFASVQENGNVQTWDLRRHDKVERQFTAHNGPVFSCDWHPEEKQWLATAGRDKSIKIWDVGPTKTTPIYQINTIASVARIKWRPGKLIFISVKFLIPLCPSRRPKILYRLQFIGLWLNLKRLGHPTALHALRSV